MRPHGAEDNDDNDIAAAVNHHRSDVEIMHEFDAEDIDASGNHHDRPESTSGQHLRGIQKDGVISLIYVVGVAENDIGVDLSCHDEAGRHCREPQSGVGQPPCIPSHKYSNVRGGKFCSLMILSTAGGPYGSDFSQTRGCKTRPNC